MQTSRLPKYLTTTLILTFLLLEVRFVTAQNVKNEKERYKVARDAFEEKNYKKYILFYERLSKDFLNEHPEASYYYFISCVEDLQLQSAANFRNLDQKKIPKKETGSYKLYQHRFDSLKNLYDSLCYAIGVSLEDNKLEGLQQVIDRTIALDRFNLYAISLKTLFYVKTNYRSEALKYCQTLISSDQYKPVGYFYRGRLFLNAEEFENAIADYSSAIKINPDKDYYWSRAEAYYRSGDFQHALTDINVVVASQPSNKKALFLKGLILYKAGDLDDAITCFKGVSKFDKGFGETNYFIGLCYSRMNRFDEAEKFFDDELKLDPRHADSWFRKGMCSLLGNEPTAEDYQKGLECLNQAIALDSLNQLYLYNRALLYKQTNRRKEAIPEFEKLIRLDSLNFSYYDQLSTCFFLVDEKPSFAKKRFYRSIHFFREKNKLTKDPGISYLIARMYLLFTDDFYGRMENYRDTALIYLNEALSADQPVIDAFETRAYIYFRKDDFEKAAHDYKKYTAVKLEAQPHWYYYMTLRNLGRYEEALKIISEAEEAYPYDFRLNNSKKEILQLIEKKKAKK